MARVHKSKNTERNPLVGFSRIKKTQTPPNGLGSQVAGSGTPVISVGEHVRQLGLEASGWLGCIPSVARRSELTPDRS